MNELGRALKWHREQHPGCDVGCPEYLAIAQEYTETRAIWEGPQASRHRLDIREA